MNLSNIPPVEWLLLALLGFSLLSTIIRLATWRSRPRTRPAPGYRTGCLVGVIFGIAVGICIGLVLEMYLQAHPSLFR